MRAALRWTRRIVLALLALVLVGAAAVLIALHTDWGRDQVRAQIEAKLRPYFPAGARVGRLEGSVLGDFTLHDIELIDREGRRAVTIRKVSINIELGAWFEDEARVERLLVEGLQIALHQQGDAPPNVATMFQPNPDPLVFDVILERLSVRDAAIVIEKDGRVEHLDGLTIDGAVFVSMDGPVAAELKVGATWRERQAPVAIHAAVQLDAVGGVLARTLHVGVGGVALDGRDLRWAGITGLRGELKLTAPEGALDALAPELGVPREAFAMKVQIVAAGVEQRPDGGLGFLVRGSLGEAWLEAALVAHPLAPMPVLAGTIRMHDLDARMGRPLWPKTALDGSVVLAVWLDASRSGLAAIRGSVAVDARGQVDAVRFERITASAVLDGQGGRVLVEGRGDGGTAIDLSAALAVDGDVVRVEDGRLVMRSRSLASAAQGHVDVRGALDADLRFHGTIDGDGGEPRFTVRGRASGRDLRYGDAAVESVAIALALDGVPETPGGTASITATGARVADNVLPELEVDARGRLGGGYDVTVRADDATRGVTARVAAVVTLGDLERTYADVRLTSYDVRSRGVRVEGRGGRIVAGADRVTVRGMRGTVAGGSFALDGVLPLPMRDEASGELALVGVDLSKLRGVPGLPPRLAGLATVRAKLARSGADLEVELRDPKLGELVASLHVIPPRRALDPAAWARLDRRAIKSLHVDARGLDLAAAGRMVGVEGLAGRIDGAMHHEGTERSAELRARGVVAAGLPAPLDADIKIGLADPSVTHFDIAATLRDLGSVRVTADVRVPVNLFDPDAWRRVGVGAVDSATVRVDGLTIDSAVAARFGLGDVRGEITAQLSAARALESVEGTLVVRDFTAGPLREPLAVTVQVHTTDGVAGVHAIASLAGVTVLDVQADARLDLVRALRRGLDPRGIPISGVLTIPELQLASLTRAVGQARRLPGTVQGTGTLSGTVTAPIATAELVIKDLGSRTPRRGGARRGGVRELKVSGRYEAGRVVAGVHGQADDGGTLALDTRVDLARPEAAVSSLVARKFELRPIARLLPDVLFGVSGVLDADLRLAGLDPATATLTGEAQLTGLTLPIHDVIGVLRDGAITFDFDARRVRAKIGGALETGRIDAVANATLEGLVPVDGSFEVTVRGIELITATAPRLDGKLSAKLTRPGDHWKIDARLQNGTVRSRSSTGRDLHPSGIPADVVFASTAPGAETPQTRARAVRTFVGDAPEVPFAEITLVIEPISVVTPQLRGDVRGRLDVAIGVDGATIEGTISVERGDLELLERRYRMRRAVVTFDGGIDPLLDLQLERELAELTLRANITGRLSAPKLHLSSDPSSYTEGQLLSFAISDTAAAPGNETTDAATNLVAALASQALVGYITPLLPVRLDVIAYEPASASSSRAFVVGRWVTRKLLVLYRNRAEARPTENVNEAEAEYWLNQRLLLEGVAGDRNVLGLDLLWTRRW